MQGRQNNNYWKPPNNLYLSFKHLTGHDYHTALPYILTQPGWNRSAGKRLTKHHTTRQQQRPGSATSSPSCSGGIWAWKAGGLDTATAPVVWLTPDFGDTAHISLGIPGFASEKLHALHRNQYYCQPWYTVFNPLLTNRLFVLPEEKIQFCIFRERQARTESCYHTTLGEGI